MSERFPPPLAEEPINPYAAPQTEIGREPAGIVFGLTDAELIRRTYLGHEASVKAIGTLTIIGGVFLVLLAIISAAGSAGILPNAFQDRGLNLLLGAFFAGLGSLSFYIGLGLRRLEGWARWTETAVVSFQILVNLILINPVGLIIGLYVLYLMLSSRGRMVFSREYRTIIEQTPYIRYKTSLLVKIVFVIFLAFLAIAVLGAIFATLSGKR